MVKNANLKKFDIFFQFFLIPSSLMAQWWVTHLLNWSQSLTDICKNTRETVLSLQRGPLVSSGSALGLPKARIWIPSTLKGAGFFGCWGCVWPSKLAAIFMQIHYSASQKNYQNISNSNLKWNWRVYDWKFWKKNPFSWFLPKEIGKVLANSAWLLDSHSRFTPKPLSQHNFRKINEFWDFLVVSVPNGIQTPLGAHRITLKYP